MKIPAFKGGQWEKSVEGSDKKQLIIIIINDVSCLKVISVIERGGSRGWREPVVQFGDRLHFQSGVVRGPVSRPQGSRRLALETAGARPQKAHLGGSEEQPGNQGGQRGMCNVGDESRDVMAGAPCGPW